MQTFNELIETLDVLTENCFHIDVPEVDSDATCSEAISDFIQKGDELACDWAAFLFNHGVYPEECKTRLVKHS